MERTFILHANGAKLPTDLLGLTCVRYGDATTAPDGRQPETVRSTLEPSAVSLLRVTRDPAPAPAFST